MGNIQLFQYNDTPMEFEVIDGQVFANATIMCQAFGKIPSAFLRLESTKRYIEALEKSEFEKHILVHDEEKVMCVNSISLVETRRGNSSDFAQGTWIHEKLILKLAQWLDVNFEIWCDEKIAELLRTGKAATKTELSRMDLILLAMEAEKENIQLRQTNGNLRMALDSLNNWSSIIRVAKHNGVKETCFDWRRLKQASKKLGYEVKKAPSPRFDYQNLYHLNAFQMEYPSYDYNLPDFIE